MYGKRDRTLAETSAAVAKQPLLFEPGARWSYCNPGIDTLGRVVEVASGKLVDKRKTGAGRIELRHLAAGRLDRIFAIQSAYGSDREDAA